MVKAKDCLGGETPPGHTRYKCKLCVKIKNKALRASGYMKTYDKERSEKLRGTRQELASRKVRETVKKGKMLRVDTLKCLDCGRPAEVYDHRDYLKPLEVDPVCKACNWKRGPALNRD